MARRDGHIYDIADWKLSATYWIDQQANLIAADNRSVISEGSEDFTLAYETTPGPIRHHGHKGTAGLGLKMSFSGKTAGEYPGRLVYFTVSQAEIHGLSLGCYQ